MARDPGAAVRSGAVTIAGQYQRFVFFSGFFELFFFFRAPPAWPRGGFGWPAKSDLSGRGLP